ncbi:hypothetical protein [Tumebacillus permanentifrigoris]|uniref:hypothetical protein n=1 Tax=Tumebacillus permanentifrigoris TaxID=378543 RepID=UPI0011B273F3|nr:hypothetical protein [Tumebacillus permanentifrigoris]
MKDTEWSLYGRGQIPSGERRGYLYRSNADKSLWKWKDVVFEAKSPQEAIEGLLAQRVSAF